MAAEHSDYQKGTMDITGHNKTFNGFVNLTTYGGAFTTVALLFPILFYGTALGWFPSLAISFVVSIILGLVLKLKGAWYVIMGVLAGIAGFLCFVFSLMLG